MRTIGGRHHPVGKERQLPRARRPARPRGAPGWCRRIGCRSASRASWDASPTAPPSETRYSGRASASDCRNRRNALDHQVLARRDHRDSSAGSAAGQHRRQQPANAVTVARHRRVSYVQFVARPQGCFVSITAAREATQGLARAASRDARIPADSRGSAGVVYKGPPQQLC